MRRPSTRRPFRLAPGECKTQRRTGAEGRAMSAEVLEHLEAYRMRAVADALAGWPGDGAGGHAEADTEFLVALCLPLADELRRYHAWTLRRAQAQPVAGMAAYSALRDGLRRVLAEGLRQLDGAAARQSGGDVARLADLEAAA